MTRNIVISAVNIRRGGTLTVLRDCLRYLSGRKDLHVTALVHKRELCDYPGIDYIEIPWSIDGWGKRLKCEYVTMKGISEKLPETDLWLSLHDTTPNVKAKRQAVYCQTSFPFLKIRLRDFRMDKKIPLFAMFTKYAYRKNVHRNDYLIVQQRWLRDGLSRILHVDKSRFIVAPPAFEAPEIVDTSAKEPVPVFLYPAAPDCHKNFELLCKASEKLEKKLGVNAFKVILTVNGAENRYTAWLRKNWGHVASIDFHGFMAREELYDCYGKAACLIFPSRVETWGLPISEFKPAGKPMLLADLPYARESAAGAAAVSFFDINDAQDLAHQMELVISGKISNFGRILPRTPEAPFAQDWDALFALLLKDESTSAR
ncbi:MAG: glycosyltransferase family 4 protein [Bacteroidales bacterium]|nr:glycosyltransferase family 4 protein [Bacteroidales bacterium]